MSEKTKIIYTCFGLLSSMINSGEEHSSQSMEVLADARNAVAELEAENECHKKALEAIRNYRLDATELATNSVYIESWRDVQRLVKEVLK